MTQEYIQVTSRSFVGPTNKKAVLVKIPGGFGLGTEPDSEPMYLTLVNSRTNTAIGPSEGAPGLVCDNKEGRVFRVALTKSAVEALGIEIPKSVRAHDQVVDLRSANINR